MRTEIRSTLKGDDRIKSVWGFGSFFRQEMFEDVDILIVVEVSLERLLSASKTIRADLLATERRVGVAIDPLILTPTEFQGDPLRDMHELVRIL